MNMNKLIHIVNKYSKTLFKKKKNRTTLPRTETNYLVFGKSKNKNNLREIKQNRWIYISENKFIYSGVILLNYLSII